MCHVHLTCALEYKYNTLYKDSAWVYVEYKKQTQARDADIDCITGTIDTCTARALISTYVQLTQDRDYMNGLNIAPQYS